MFQPKQTFSKYQTMIQIYAEIIEILFFINDFFALKDVQITISKFINVLDKPLIKNNKIDKESEVILRQLVFLNLKSEVYLNNAENVLKMMRSYLATLSVLRVDKFEFNIRQAILSCPDHEKFMEQFRLLRCWYEEFEIKDPIVGVYIMQVSAGLEYKDPTAVLAIAEKWYEQSLLLTNHVSRGIEGLSALISILQNLKCSVPFAKQKFYLDQILLLLSSRNETTEAKSFNSYVFCEEKALEYCDYAIAQNIDSQFIENLFFNFVKLKIYFHKNVSSHARSKKKEAVAAIFKIVESAMASAIPSSEKITILNYCWDEFAFLKYAEYQTRLLNYYLDIFSKEPSAIQSQELLQKITSQPKTIFENQTLMLITVDFLEYLLINQPLPTSSALNIYNLFLALGIASLLKDTTQRVLKLYQCMGDLLFANNHFSEAEVAYEQALNLVIENDLLDVNIDAIVQPLFTIYSNKIAGIESKATPDEVADLCQKIIDLPIAEAQKQLFVIKKIDHLILIAERNVALKRFAKAAKFYEAALSDFEEFKINDDALHDKLIKGLNLANQNDQEIEQLQIKTREMMINQAQIKQSSEIGLDVDNENNNNNTNSYQQVNQTFSNAEKSKAQKKYVKVKKDLPTNEKQVDVKEQLSWWHPAMKLGKQISGSFVNPETSTARTVFHQQGKGIEKLKYSNPYRYGLFKKVILEAETGNNKLKYMAENKVKWEAKTPGTPARIEGTFKEGNKDENYIVFEVYNRKGFHRSK